MCQTCRHGGHAAHILDGFMEKVAGPLHDVCLLQIVIVDASKRFNQDAHFDEEIQSD